MKIFVYGTLKLNQPNHHFLRGRSTRIAANARIAGLKLYDLGAFPGAVMSSEASDCVYGEIYEVHHDNEDFVRQSLDRLEGHPSFYERQVRQATDENGSHHDVNVYVFLHSVQGYALLPNGIWGVRKVVQAKGSSDESQGKQAQGR